MAPQNSTLIFNDIDDDDDDLPSVATSEKITSLLGNYSPILRPKSAGDRYYAKNVPTVAGIYIPPSTQKKSIFTKNTVIKNGKTTYDDVEKDVADEEVCTIHNHFMCFFVVFVVRVHA